MLTGKNTAILFLYRTGCIHTRTTPSQKFDLLSDDFDYLALLAAMFAMFSATMAAWYLSWMPHAYLWGIQVDY